MDRVDVRILVLGGEGVCAWEMGAGLGRRDKLREKSLRMLRKRFPWMKLQHEGLKLGSFLFTCIYDS